MLSPLNRAGYDNKIIEELTGLPASVQSRWLIASEVYQSVKKTGLLSDDELAFYDNQGDDLLYELRYTEFERRPAVRIGRRTAACCDSRDRGRLTPPHPGLSPLPKAVAFMCREQFDQKQAVILARTIKEHERKREG